MNLKTKLVGKHILFYDRVSSTMDIARDLALKGADEGTVTVAAHQESGRGRFNRTWISPPGNLYLSLILRPKSELLSRMVMLSAVAVQRAVFSITGLVTSIKWPNDVLLKGKKVSGIILESNIKGEKVDFVIVGIGLNVNMDTSLFSDISLTSTSLMQELGQRFEPEEVLKSLLSHLDGLYLLLGDGAYIYHEWRRCLVTIGEVVSVRFYDKVETGKVTDVTQDGSLLIRRENGTLLEAPAGDITIIKGQPPPEK